MFTPAIRNGAYSAKAKAAMCPIGGFSSHGRAKSASGHPATGVCLCGVCARPPYPVGSGKVSGLTLEPSRMRACGNPRALFIFPTPNGMAVMTRRKKIYEGKAKILYEGPEPGTLIQYFKDDATAFNASKKAILEGKGVINNRISEYVMVRLNGIGVQNHFIKRLNLREQLIKEVEIIPLEVVCRNIAAGSLSQRL